MGDETFSKDLVERRRDQAGGPQVVTRLSLDPVCKRGDDRQFRRAASKFYLGLPNQRIHACIFANSSAGLMVLSMQSLTPAL